MTKYYTLNIIFNTYGSELKSTPSFRIEPIYFIIHDPTNWLAKATILGSSSISCIPRITQMYTGNSTIKGSSSIYTSLILNEKRLGFATVFGSSALLCYGRVFDIVD